MTLAPGAQAADPAPFAGLDGIFADDVLDERLPGLVYGVVAEGQLVHVRGIGVQDLEARRPVTADTVFRIASMTKAFTALTVLGLRDKGKLQLDAPAEDYVPELRAWTYPTLDSRRIRVRDLLNHTAGFVTDDPWGDRQTPLAEKDFTRLLREGVPFAHPPAMAFEYSNLGYALLGRVLGNVSGRPYAETINRSLLAPLGMSSSTFLIEEVPAEHRALGYRWEDDAWRPEPAMVHGAFGAMGGLHTSANDYSKWVAYLLSAWPPRDDEDAGPVRRATVRELAQGSGFHAVWQPLPAPGAAAACARAYNYGMGMGVSRDCEFGLMLHHSGGYPGYGSHVLLLPEQGVGIFALSNRTYADLGGPVYAAALSLKKAGFLQEGVIPVSDALAKAYRAAGTIYTLGNITAGGDVLAENMLMDRDAAGWGRDLAELAKEVGTCDTTTPPVPSSALGGDFEWRCEHGRVSGAVLLSPTRPPRIQSLVLDRIEP